VPNDGGEVPSNLVPILTNIQLSKSLSPVTEQISEVVKDDDDDFAVFLLSGTLLHGLLDGA
jgi:hypothetical protein